MEKQKLLSEQARLADRGAAEMVLMYISASKGTTHDSRCFCSAKICETTVHLQPKIEYSTLIFGLNNQRYV